MISFFFQEHGWLRRLYGELFLTNEISISPSVLHYEPGFFSESEKNMKFAITLQMKHSSKSIVYNGKSADVVQHCDGNNNYIDHTVSSILIHYNCYVMLFLNEEHTTCFHNSFLSCNSYLFSYVNNT